MIILVYALSDFSTSYQSHSSVEIRIMNGIEGGSKQKRAGSFIIVTSFIHFFLIIFFTNDVEFSSLCCHQFYSCLSLIIAKDAYNFGRREKLGRGMIKRREKDKYMLNRGRKRSSGIKS